MSLIIHRFLLCNGCGRAYGVDKKCLPTDEHRKNAREEGWATNGQHDYCPTCKEERRELGCTPVFPRVAADVPFPKQCIHCKRFGKRCPEYLRRKRDGKN
jgi:hypothetical protein